MNKLHIFVMVFVFSFIISGCASPEESIYETVEATAVKEENFDKQQEPLAELEAAEKSLFDKIMALGMKEFDQITKLADEALVNLDKREEFMKKEKESLDASKEELNKATEEINKIKDNELKKQAEEMQQLMNNRYKTHEQLYSAYLSGLSEDRKIYQLIKDKNLKMEDLTDQIEKANQAYESVFELNSQFNEQTEKLNEAKIKFYKNAGINIEKSS
ncbi:YkyA family protein [Lederbergia citrea]|uniref:YkyA family protein n=1 Tax=Lederbergia citrea TaxID=2833581 RepID=A0A942ULJ4_9BACI|nr:YkyA family protein [Lederbergia citrea]MBS4177276.1 YkyA family protein [Lederbergia citrea]MBS4203939.1 YkyA family protein [Lederbergia citrea]MBS4221477.1 YkyA family protein [Lederbergia citrea]